MLGFEISQIRSVDVMTSLCPLEWCKMQNTQFSTISKLARAIPASSPPSESRSVFKSQVDPGATAMEPVLPQRLEASIMLKHNAWMLRRK